LWSILLQNQNRNHLSRWLRALQSDEPHFIAEAVQVLGFKDIQFSIHRQRHVSREMDLYTIVAKRNSPGRVRYNEEAYNQIILQNFNYDQYMLNHIPARRLVRHLGSRMLKKLGLARQSD
jgi:hypothetical protein